MIYTKSKHNNKRLSPLAYKVSQLLGDASTIIKDNDTQQNILYVLTQTISHLNKLLIPFLGKDNNKNLYN
jgi:hypothetical protein